jgi:hypothetical protein
MSQYFSLGTLFSASLLLSTIVASTHLTTNAVEAKPYDSTQAIDLTGSAPQLVAQQPVAASEVTAVKPFSQFEITPNISSTGLGISIATPVSSKVKARIGYNAFSTGTSFTSDDVDYDVKLKLSNFTAGAEFFPMGPKSGFFVGGGLALQGNRLEGVGKPNLATSSLPTSFTFNGTTYNTSDVGELQAKVKYPNTVAPYLGVGYSSPIASKSKFGFFANLGVLFAGKPEVELTATGPIATNPLFQADLNEEIKNAREDVNLPSIYPVLSLGVSYRF